jgi:hypothetical protein
VLYSCLEGVGAAELRVYDDQTDGPVYDDCEPYEEGGACDEAGVTDSIGLANDASASARYQLAMPRCT